MKTRTFNPAAVDPYMMSFCPLRLYIISLAILFSACSTVPGSQRGEALGPSIQGSILNFENAARSGDFLSTRDDFIHRLTPMDRALRLCGDPLGTETTLLANLRTQGREWVPTELAKFQAVVTEVDKWANHEGLQLHLPASVPVYKSSNEVEFGMSFTRGNAIVLSEELAASPELYRRVLAHEIFHIISRSRGDIWQDQLYQLLGFRRISPQSLALPPALAARLITNPDTFHAFVSLKVRKGSDEQEVIPLLVSKVEINRLARSCDNFAQIELRLLPIRRTASGTIRPLSNSANFAEVLWRVEHTNFNRQVFADYGDHPEEIFADAFAHLIVGLPKKTVPIEILQRFMSFLKTK